MDNSYIENIKSSFSLIEIPLNEEQMAKLGAASALKPQTRYVAKSERVQELKKELAVAERLNQKIKKISSAWENGWDSSRVESNHLVQFNFEPLHFAQYQQDGTEAAISTLVAEVQKKVDCYASCVSKAVEDMGSTLASVCENLEYALESENKGIDGESRVEAYLNRKLDCRILSSVILPGVQENTGSPKTAETDLLVISHHGIFVCEIKNYGKAGQTLEVQPNGEIVKRDYYGRVLEYLGSPFEQNARHCEAVKRVLEDDSLAYMPIFPVVIIANTDVNVVNNSNYMVMDMYCFADMVSASNTKVVFSNEQQNMAFTAIQRKRMIERKFPIFAVSSIQDDIEEALGFIETVAASKDEWRKKAKETVKKSIAAAHEVWLREHPLLARNSVLLGSLDFSPYIGFLWLIMVLIANVRAYYGYKVHVSYDVIGYALFLLNMTSLSSYADRKKKNIGKGVFIRMKESPLVGVQNMILTAIYLLWVSLPIWLYILYLIF